MGAPFDMPKAAEAQALYARRELRQALDFGFALLDALDLPPLALDVIDDAIAHLDALDAPAEDLEPSLGWTESGPRFCGDYQDCELDIADWEPSLASPEHHPASPACFSGGPYTARGGEESQLRWAQGAQHDGEAVNEDGTDLDVGEDDGLILGEADSADHEPHLGSAAGDGDQRHWNQGDHRDVEAVNEGGGGQYNPNWRERQPSHVRAMYDDMRTLQRRAQAMKRRGAPRPPEPVRILTPTGICNVLNVDGTPFVWAVEPMVAHG